MADHGTKRKRVQFDSSPPPTNNRGWSAEENEMIINSNRREEGESFLRRDQLHALMPHHSFGSVKERYDVLTKRDLRPEEISQLWHLWMIHREDMFGRLASVCRVTIAEYERIAYCYAAGIRQSQYDIDNIDFDFISRNYEHHCVKIWRVITTKLPVLIPWQTAERVWVFGLNEFCRVV